MGCKEMNGYLFDTDILIWHLRGRADIVKVVEQLAEKNRLYISAISRTEVVMGMLPKEEMITMEFLSSLATCPVDKEVADKAGEYIRIFRKKGVFIEIPDALIAATAVTNNLVLVTLNLKDYPMEDVKKFSWLNQKNEQQVLQ
jgi:predicted nucleic acid-binding protein